MVCYWIFEPCIDRVVTKLSSYLLKAGWHFWFGHFINFNVELCKNNVIKVWYVFISGIHPSHYSSFLVFIVAFWLCGFYAMRICAMLWSFWVVSYWRVGGRIHLDILLIFIWISLKFKLNCIKLLSLTRYGVCILMAFVCVLMFIVSITLCSIWDLLC